MHLSSSPLIQILFPVILTVWLLVLCRKKRKTGSATTESSPKKSVSGGSKSKSKSKTKISLKKSCESTKTGIPVPPDPPNGPVGATIVVPRSGRGPARSPDPCATQQDSASHMMPPSAGPQTARLLVQLPSFDNINEKDLQDVPNIVPELEPSPLLKEKTCASEIEVEVNLEDGTCKE